MLIQRLILIGSKYRNHSIYLLGRVRGIGNRNLFLAIMNYGASYFTNCLANPLIIQALKTLKIKPKELNLARDVKDFIMMNIDWMKKGKELHIVQKQ